MIKLNKLEAPEVLKKNAQNWTEQYNSLLEANEPVPDALKSKYRIREVKNVIKTETHGKCAYCESKVGHVCPGDVEHILPKIHRPELIFNWVNLTLACEECNRSGKKAYYNPIEPLINPYNDDPSEHLISAGPMILQQPGDRKGYITQLVLKLNRPELIEKRAERLKSIQSLIESWANEKDPIIKDLLTNALLIEAEDDKEYSFMVRSYLRTACGI